MHLNHSMNKFASALMDYGRDADGREVLRGLVSRERKTLKLLIEVLERLNYFNDGFITRCGEPIDFSNTDAIPDAVWKALDRPHLVSGNQWMQLAESLPADVNPLLKQAMMRNGFAKWELEKHLRQFGDGV
jgi:hypothetical protein